MLGSFPLSLVVGTALGYLAGLGVGGGSLLILWLTAIVHMDAAATRVINLLFFICSAGSICLVRWFQGTLNTKALFPAVLSGCCSAALAAYCTQFVNQEIIRKLFGGLLIIIGVQELFYRPRKAK